MKDGTSQDDRDEFDVAVVVFARTRGVDARDASHAAQAAVRGALTGLQVGRLPCDLTLRARWGEQSVTVIDVHDVGVAISNGYFHVQPSARAARDIGLGAPAKGSSVSADLGPVSS